MLHILIHLLAPAVFAGVFYRKRFRDVYLVLLATMLVDLDHLLADPIYDVGRCSIGFHPLHQPLFVMLYVALCFIPKTRIIGIGLTLHMVLDSIDCQVTNGIWGIF